MLYRFGEPMLYEDFARFHIYEPFDPSSRERSTGTAMPCRGWWIRSWTGSMASSTNPTATAAREAPVCFRASRYTPAASPHSLVFVQLTFESLAATRRTLPGPGRAAFCTLLATTG
jgi:hypothetical protein